MSRVKFEIRGKAIHAEHAEYGWIKIVACASPDAARAFLTENYNAVEWETVKAGTFEAFSQ